MNFLTLENITLIIAIGGATVGVYHFFRNPDIKADKSISLLNQLLKETQKKNDSLMEMNKNHIHTLDCKVEDIKTDVQEIKIGLSNVVTIIDERIPKKI